MKRISMNISQRCPVCFCEHDYATEADAKSEYKIWRQRQKKQTERKSKMNDFNRMAELFDDFGIEYEIFTTDELKRDGVEWNAVISLHENGWGDFVNFYFMDGKYVCYSILK